MLDLLVIAAIGASRELYILFVRVDKRVPRGDLGISAVLGKKTAGFSSSSFLPPPNHSFLTAVLYRGFYRVSLCDAFVPRSSAAIVLNYSTADSAIECAMMINSNFAPTLNR